MKTSILTFVLVLTSLFSFSKTVALTQDCITKRLADKDALRKSNILKIQKIEVNGRELYYMEIKKTKRPTLVAVPYSVQYMDENCKVVATLTKKINEAAVVTEGYSEFDFPPKKVLETLWDAQSQASSLSAPELITPSANSIVNGPTIFTGKAEPNAIVNVTTEVSTVTTCIPHAIEKGPFDPPIKKQQTTADAAGNWSVSIDVTYRICREKTVVVSATQQSDGRSSLPFQMTFSGDSFKKMKPEETGKAQPAETKSTNKSGTTTEANSTTTDKKLRIISPKLNQKVRGNVVISGTAAANSSIDLSITSMYIPLVRSQEKYSKGEGTKQRLSRKYRIKADSRGTWTKSIDLTNSEWREDYTIKVTSVDGKNNVEVKVYDDTRPVRID